MGAGFPTRLGCPKEGQRVRKSAPPVFAIHHYGVVWLPVASGRIRCDRLRSADITFLLSLLRARAGASLALATFSRSIHRRFERSGQCSVVEQTAGQGGHERAGNPGIRTIAEGHPQARPLPLHPAIKDALRAADDAIGLEKEAWSDGVSKGGHQGRATLEARQRILFDRQRMEFCPQPMRLGFHSAILANSPAKWGSQKAIWQTRPIPKITISSAPLDFSSPMRSA